jgi:putative phosphoesterase
MKIAVISDIHGNCLALDAVLSHMQRDRPDSVVCLGDALQGGPQPRETVERLRALGCPIVMGNADAWLLSGVNTSDNEQVTEQQLQVRQWSLSQLSPDDIAFIEGFKPTIEINLEGTGKLFCFHGSPASFDELIFPETPEEDFQRMLGDYTGSLMCGGHTHLQQIRRIGKFFFFNPGSVGLAYDRNVPEDRFRIDPWAEYAVLTSDGGNVSLDLRRVPYDVEELIRIYRRSGIPGPERIIEQYTRGLEKSNNKHE